MHSSGFGAVIYEAGGQIFRRIIELLGYAELATQFRPVLCIDANAQAIVRGLDGNLGPSANRHQAPSWLCLSWEADIQACDDHVSFESSTHVERFHVLMLSLFKL